MKTRKVLKHSSFLSYILHWMLGFGVLAVLFFGIVSYICISQMSEKIINSRIHEVLSRSTHVLESELADLSQKLDVLAHDESIIGALERGVISQKGLVRSRLHGSLRGKSRELMLSVLSLDDICSTGEAPPFYGLREFAHWGVLRWAIEGKISQLYPNAYVRPSGEQNACSLARPIYKGDKLLGILILDFSRRYFVDLFADYAFGVGDEMGFFLQSDMGSVIYRSQDASRMSKILLPSREDSFDTGKEHLFAESYLSQRGLHCTAFVGRGYVRSQMRMYYSVVSLALALSLIGIILIGRFMGSRMVRPILSLANRVKDIGDGCSSLTKTRNDEIGEIEVAIIELIDQIESYHVLEAEKIKELRVAEMNMLVSQMNPHFLYNALDSIKWQAKLHKAGDVSQMAIELGVLLKHTMNIKSSIIPLSEELKIIQSYLFIQRQRYSDRFSFVQDIDESLYGIFIPKFLLQPLIENAIVHGLEEQSEPIIISLRAYEDKEKLIFEVEDSGCGFTRSLSEILQEQRRESHLKSSIALSNLQKRIELSYGKGFGLELMSSVGDVRGSRIRVCIAKEIKPGDSNLEI